jgi:hypothetical protein
MVAILMKGFNFHKLNTSKSNFLTGCNHQQVCGLFFYSFLLGQPARTGKVNLNVAGK